MWDFLVVRKKMALSKVVRFIHIYGIRRTLFKVLGRSNSMAVIRLLIPMLVCKKNKRVSVIGCGQFSTSTIGSILSKNKIGVLSAFDINSDKQKRFCEIYGSKGVQIKNECICLHGNPDVVYIASNHASHTDYACQLIQQGHDVYIEKPVSVTHDQFRRLFSIIKTYKQRVFIGYNRPFARAFAQIFALLCDDDLKKPFSLNCFISGHLLEEGHWYRDPEEGSRVCGNLGHWIDLCVHCFSKRGFMPESIMIQVMSANKENPDDDLVVTLKTPHNDICSMMLTARSEPFEGINETINFQQSNLIAKIDDFRQLVIWKGVKKNKYNYRIKDPGHMKSIMQPFSINYDWQQRLREVEFSTLLMLKIKEMVMAGIRTTENFVIPELHARFYDKETI
jgi:predicted dehydrogenase